MQSETRNCRNCEQQFVIEPEDFGFYEKIQVPAPTFCPNCRFQRRLLFWNPINLYRRTCDLCKEFNISAYPPDAPYKVYCPACWWSDKWDSFAYGRDYDFSRPFFEQINELWHEVPILGLSLDLMSVKTSPFNHDSGHLKNCYLLFNADYDEDSAYGYFIGHSQTMFDCAAVEECQMGYDSMHSYRTNHCIGSRHQLSHSIDCLFCRDCQHCQNCFGSANLKNKKYYIFNKPYSKEDYQKFLKNNHLGLRENFSRLNKESERTWLTVPHRDTHIVKAVNSTGYSIIESKNAKNCWNGEQLENCKNLYIAGWVKDSYDGTAIGGSELSYENTSGGGFYNSKFLAFAMSKDPIANLHTTYELEYCYCPMLGHNCFGCANAKNQEYCILNKKYSKKDYANLLAKIKQHMDEMPYVDKKGRTYKYGEFFPSELSPYGYNETAAMDYYPLTREEALAKGFSWSDYEIKTDYKFSDYVIPDDIRDVKDDILEKILKCEASGRPYRIIPMELQFLRRIGLPIPRRAPLQRHKDRMARLLPRKLFDRTCQCAGINAEKGGYANTISHFHGNDHCPTKIQTPYDPNRPEIIYCEQCYQSEVA